MIHEIKMNFMIHEVGINFFTPFKLKHLTMKKNLDFVSVKKNY